jgi:hypothetical protein
MEERIPRELLTDTEHIDLLTGGSERALLEQTFNKDNDQGVWRACAFCSSQATKPYYATGNADVIFVCSECWTGLTHERAARAAERQ